MENDVFFDSMMWGILANAGTHDQRAVATNEVGDITIDTCDTYDCGYETAIWYKDNAMVIVERYANRELAEAGHKLWTDKVIGWVEDDALPDQLYSAQTGNMEEWL